jgi:hypothetical protein
MIKDIIVNLEHRAPHDPACDYAISIAQAFSAHTTGVAFVYEPDLPGHVRAEFPSDILAQLRAKSGEAARAAIDRFEDAARRSLLSVDHRLHQATEAGVTPEARLSQDGILGCDIETQGRSDPRLNSGPPARRCP